MEPATLVILSEEVKRFQTFVDKTLNYFTTRYPQELVEAKRYLAEFKNEPFEKEPQKTIEYLKLFSENCTLAVKELTILTNTFQSRIGTFSSNFKLSQDIIEAPNETIREHLATMFTAVSESKKEIVEQYTTVNENIRTLLKLITEENK